MASIKVILDKRRAKEDNTFPIYFRLIHKREARNISIGYYCSVKDWDEKEKAVKSSYPNSRRVNFHIQRKLTEAKKVIVDNEERLNNLDIDQLKYLITNENSSLNFFTYAENIVKRLKTENRFGSATTYNCCISSIKKFHGNQNLKLSDITFNFLIEFESYCKKEGLKVNSIGNYMRSLRAIINLAINGGLIKQDQYPFKKFKIKKEETLKRAISKEEILKIINADTSENIHLLESKNYFAFMFYMKGMNFIDLAYLKMKNIQGDRIIYNRIKTKKQYNIKITEQAKKILDNYITNKNSDDLVFPILPLDLLKEKENKSIEDKEKIIKIYREKLKRFNENLKELAKVADVKTNITTYVTRHSWASIAKFSGISPALIGESLGHSDLKTTETYLANFDHKALDDANDAIIN